uniref:3-hydroxyisobutyryl-CoA hydrolase n=1 Tax=Nephromyces sp. MMRI TaxID=2496275 RepID=A0A3S8V3D4_9APIC|nr:3-hydroxyisobutyryl-coenzyme A hydrolase / CoA-thioester hydrolase [Nephromyces sp. MMRI]AZL94699.1 3-hydroxyisobutyryl-coenzyme A hydrolase / CoA-thioester hydrolase [Nephromyces sp. MMRI]
MALNTTHYQREVSYNKRINTHTSRLCLLLHLFYPYLLRYPAQTLSVHLHLLPTTPPSPSVCNSCYLHPLSTHGTHLPPTRLPPNPPTTHTSPPAHTPSRPSSSNAKMNRLSHLTRTLSSRSTRSAMNDSTRCFNDAYKSNICNANQTKEFNTLHKLAAPKEYQADGLSLTIHHNGVCQYEIQRPKQLNAINHDIVTAMTAFFTAADKLQYCKAIIMTGAGNKSFCAGGDIRQASSSPPEYAIKFFALEYLTDYLTSITNKPMLSIWKGFVMGGGVGISLFGRYRIATDDTIFSMPETVIGFFPDCGVTSQLCKIKCGVGLYAGLTAARLNAHDVMKYGLATHFIPQTEMSQFLNELNQTNLGDEEEAVKSIEIILNKYSDNAFERLTPNIGDDIENGMNVYSSKASSFQDFYSILKANEGDSFCQQTLQHMSNKSPLSCAVYWRQYHLCKSNNMSLLDALKLEYRLAQTFVLKDPNFKEGVRATLVDKDNKPKWSHTFASPNLDEDAASLFDNPNAIDMETALSMQGGPTLANYVM